MRFERIELKNIGVFAEAVSADLACARSAPIVLIGGRNGSGKTTILEAIQWALYGTLVRTPRRTSGESSSYSEYLGRLRHRGARSNDDAYVELQMTLRRGRRNLPLTVRREICVGESRWTDRLDVCLDGSYLGDPASEWPLFMDSVLPNQLSNLFFFDGEQIERIVDPEHSRHFIRTGVHALLGIDVVDQLDADLRTLERRKRVAAAAPTDVHRLRALEEQYKRLTEALRVTREAEALARGESDQAEKELASAEARFRLHGGDKYEARGQTKRELQEAEAERHGIEEEMRALAEGVLPMVFIAPVARQMLDLATKARELEHVRREESVADELLAELLNWLRDREVSSSAAAEVEEFRRQRAVGRPAPAPAELPRGFGEDASVRLQALFGGLLHESITRGRELLQSLQRAEERVAQVSRSLSALPEEDDVRALQQAIQSAEERRAQAHSALRRAELDTRHHEVEHERVHNEVEKTLRKTALVEHDHEKLDRLVEAGERTRAILGGFRRGLVRANLKRIEGTVWRKFRQLMHKEHLGARVRIDPDTYELAVHSSDGEPLPPERLSAGERQLLATAVLWGLAEASGRRLPVIVDTPLGRLDHGHRERLVRDYFPSAGRQVILLSTDEEIGAQWLATLGPSIAKSYTLEFTDRDQVSRIRSGYFEESQVVS